MNFTVREEDADIRLDRWVKRCLPHLNHGVLEKALRKGWVKLDKKKAATSTRVQAGQVVFVAESLAAVSPESAAKEQAQPRIRPEDAKWMRQAVIYEDADMIAINKPAGIAVQGGSKQTISIDVLAAALAPEGKQAPKLVHRLDKDTSGVLLLAKHTKSATQLTKLFSGKNIEKQYTALVVGVPKPKEGVINLPLLKQSRAGDLDRELVEVDREFGKEAVTEYKVTEAIAKKLAWVELNPITGRTHQLRVHMAAINHPIVGDGKYGAARQFQAGDMGLSKKLHLHAATITITKPDGKKLTIEAELPEHMRESQALLG